MSTRQTAPTGAPCWADLWTSDVAGAGTFYGELFGWEAQEPSEEFGGYFMFTRDGVPVAGGMGDMVDMKADDRWRIYLSTHDIAATADAAARAGADVVVPPMPVADLGIQLVFTDPTGAALGAWQPGTFPGFTVLAEHGAPSWFELHTRSYQPALDFYRSVFDWTLTPIGETDEFRYSTATSPDGGDEIGGLLDASGILPDGAAGYWTVYWEVDDIDHAAATVAKLGGSVVAEPQDTPYGRMATVRDPAGAEFRLRTGPR